MGTFGVQYAQPLVLAEWELVEVWKDMFERTLFEDSDQKKTNCIMFGRTPFIIQQTKRFQQILSFYLQNCLCISFMERHLQMNLVRKLGLFELLEASNQSYNCKTIRPFEMPSLLLLLIFFSQKGFKGITCHYFSFKMVLKDFQLLLKRSKCEGISPKTSYRQTIAQSLPSRSSNSPTLKQTDRQN